MTCYYCDLPVVVRQLRKMPYSYVLKFVKARPSFARGS